MESMDVILLFGIGCSLDFSRILDNPYFPPCFENATFNLITERKYGVMFPTMILDSISVR